MGRDSVGELCLYVLLSEEEEDADDVLCGRGKFILKIPFFFFEGKRLLSVFDFFEILIESIDSLFFSSCCIEDSCSGMMVRRTFLL